MVRADEPSAVGEAQRAARARGGRWAKPVALIAGVLATLFAIAVPLLPVQVDKTTLAWPQQDSARSITAPLVSYAPLTFDATIPGAALQQLGERGGLAAASMPADAPDLDKYGFVARVRPAQDDRPARFEVVLRSQSMFSVPVDGLADATLKVHSDMSSTTAELAGTGAKPVELQGDFRPQLVGVFSDLPDAAGTTVNAEVDSRFSVTPTFLKRAATVLAVGFALIALAALFRLDRFDGRRVRRLLPQRWWTFTAPDAVVLGTLVLWHFIGSTTSDDGYQFGMARTSLAAGYMANYFRFFGVPENPVGTPPYDVIAHMTEISTASPWIRLPTLLAAVITWLALSREVIPRLGVAVRHDKVAVWTGALGFLAVWLPYNNGLRPEPIIAVSVLLTWCFVERAIATRRLLPYAIAILVAAFSLTAAPSGIICVAPLLAGARSVVRFGMVRARELAVDSGAEQGGSDGSGISRWAWVRAYGALLAPLAASGVLVLAFAFAVEPLSAMFEMKRVHNAVGPSVPWFDDYLTYQWLFMPSADGSIGRRFGIIAMWVGLLVCAFVMLRKGGRIPFVAAGPAKRLLGITFGAMLLMATVPTKFTHHNGVYAGLAGAVAVVAAVAVGPRVMRAPRYRALFAAIVAVAMAQIFTSVNEWWYVSSYGIPWWDSAPSIFGIGLSKVFLIIAVLCLLLAAWWHVRAPEPGTPHRISPRAWRFAKIPPLTVVAALIVLFEVLSFAKGAVTQYPAFSLARSNINAALGEPCGLANDVLVEDDPNSSMLTPLTGDPMSAFAQGNNGYMPNGVGDLTPDDQPAGNNSSIANAFGDKSDGSSGTQTGGAPLPFGLAPGTPELGTSGQQEAADLTTGWYRLPDPADRSGIVAITAAGRFRAITQEGSVMPGQPIDIEYGTSDSPTTARSLGTVMPLDIGPTPSWRNLRVPLDQIPPQADVIRIVAKDKTLDPRQWMALTPPRIPHTRTLNELIGSKDPVLLDWAVGLQFPCQRPFDHKDGIAQVPGWRILPDRPAAHDTDLWESHDGGGPLGWSQQLLRTQTLATYLKDDWNQDWGQLQKLTPIDSSATLADPEVTQQSHSGLWSPGPINTGW